MILDTDSLQMTAAVEREFRMGTNARAAIAAVQQAKLNAAVAATEHKTIDGVGQLIASIDADVYWAMRARFGAECWQDKGFLADAQRSGLVAKPTATSRKMLVQH